MASTTTGTLSTAEIRSRSRSASLVDATGGGERAGSAAVYPVLSTTAIRSAAVNVAGTVARAFSVA